MNDELVPFLVVCFALSACLLGLSYVVYKSFSSGTNQRVLPSRKLLRTPNEVAAARIQSQLMVIEDELVKLADIPNSDSGGSSEATRLRQRWAKAQLSAVPVESLDVEGISPRMFLSLRDAGYRNVGALESLRPGGVPGIGEGRVGLLRAAYDSTFRSKLALAETLPLEQIAAELGSQESQATQIPTQSRYSQSQRRITELRIRRRELRERLEVIKGRKPQQP